MELASMLAGEPFSDHPVTVCPVIGAFLRTYNDGLDDVLRQDLYHYASAVVGTAGPGARRRERARIARRWALELAAPHGTAVRGLAWRLRLALWPLHVGAVAAKAALSEEGVDAHRGALRLLDTMLSVGSERDPAPFPLRVGAPTSQLAADGRTRG
jgi:hypothetical protein